MPVKKCSNGKYRIGTGKCMYKSKASADRAYKGYLGSKYMNEKIDINEKSMSTHFMFDSGMEVPIVVTYTISAHRPATMLEPEEHPEIEISDITTPSDRSGQPGRPVDIDDDGIELLKVEIADHEIDLHDAEEEAEYDRISDMRKGMESADEYDSMTHNSVESVNEKIDINEDGRLPQGLFVELYKKTQETGDDNYAFVADKLQSGEYGEIMGTMIHMYKPGLLDDIIAILDKYGVDIGELESPGKHAEYFYADPDIKKDMDNSMQILRNSYEENINEKVDLKVATVDEDDMGAEDIKKMMKLANIKEKNSVNEKIDLKAATVDEDDMDSGDLKQMMRLAGIEKDLPDEEKKDINFRGALHKPIGEGEFSIFRELEEVIQKKIELTEDFGDNPDDVTFFSLDDQGMKALGSSGMRHFVDFGTENSPMSITTDRFRLLVDAVSERGGKIFTPDSDEDMRNDFDDSIDDHDHSHGISDDDDLSEMPYDELHNAPVGYVNENHFDRTEKFTDEEFKALKRYEDGSVEDLSSAYIWMTPEQLEILGGDDQSRVGDYQEEMNHMMADLKNEFGEDASSEKKLGRRKAGTWGRPVKDNHRIASKAVRRSGKEELKKADLEEDEKKITAGSEVETPQGHGIVIEINAEGTAFVELTDKSADQNIVEIKLSEIHKISEAGHVADPYGGSMISPYDKEPSSQEVENALDYITDHLAQYLDTDEMAKATLADLKSGMHPEDKSGSILDLISDATGTIRNQLDNDDMLYFSDDEIENIVKEKLAKMGLVAEGIKLSAGSYDRLVMEMILAEMKLGKTPEEIAEELSFDEDQIKAVCETVTTVKKN